MNTQEHLYPDEMRMVREKIHFLGIKPLTSIRIHMYYPEGWCATFGGTNNNVYVFTYSNGRVELTSVEPLIGFFPGGGLIRPADDYEGLLISLERKEEEYIIMYANSLFIKGYSTVDLNAVKKFEDYAHCTVYNLEMDSAGWLVGEIQYRGEYFGWGYIDSEEF